MGMLGLIFYIMIAIIVSWFMAGYRIRNGVK